MKLIKVRVPIDAAKKIEKFFSENVDWCKQPATVRPMPDQPDPANRVLSVRVSRELYRKLQKGAETMGDGFNDHVRNVLVSKTDHIELTREDYEIILAEKEAYIKSQKAKGKL